MPRTLGLLTLTHSSRRNDPARCSVQFLTRRFGAPGRLAALPPFEELPPPEPLYGGAVSFFGVEVAADGGEKDPRDSKDIKDKGRKGPGGGMALRPLGWFRDREKVQHVALLGEADLLLGYEQRVERWRLPAPVAELPGIDLRSASRVWRAEHPHLAALHTVAPLPGGRRALLSSSAADAVLVLDLATGAVERTLRLPAELYGHNYELSAGRDLRRHFIGDEAQTTHVNAAWPTPDGRRAVVSTLIQGAIGELDLESGGYRELTRGFVGCHGARVSAEGEVYFADSTAGCLVFLDADGRIARRFGVRSRWLHDVQQIGGPVYAFALADRNALEVWDVAREVLLGRRRFVSWPFEGAFSLAARLPGWRGNSVQALGFWPLPSPGAQA